MPTHIDEIEEQYAGRIGALWFEPDDAGKTVRVVTDGRDPFVLYTALEHWRNEERVAIRVTPSLTELPRGDHA